MLARRLAIRLEQLLNGLLLLAISVMVGCIGYQVFARYVLQQPPAWTEEVARFLMAWVTMLASAAVLRQDGHIAVTVLVDALPRPLRLALDWLRDVLVLVMAGSLAYYGWVFAGIGGRRDSAALEISMWYPYLAIPVGAVLIALLTVLGRLAGSHAGDRNPAP